MLQHQVFKFLCSNLNNRIPARLSDWKGISTISDGSTDEAPAAPAASSGPARLRTTLDCFGMAWHWFLHSGCWNSMRSSSLVWWSHQVVKRWSLLIGEPKAATASTAKKRTIVKRIGSMADMQCFLKFIIRVFRQSRGGGLASSLDREWADCASTSKRNLRISKKPWLPSLCNTLVGLKTDPPYWDVIFPSKYRNSRNAVWQEHSTYEFIFPVSRPGGVLRRAIPLPIHSQ